MADYFPDINDTKRPHMFLIELTYLSKQWLPTEEPPQYSFWMASSEVDQKFLGHFAKTTSVDNGYLSRYDSTHFLAVAHSSYWS